MYLRILALIWFIRPEFVEAVWGKLVLLAAVGLVFSINMDRKNPATEKPPINAMRNPFEIRPALIFATLFVVMSIVTIIAERFYGTAGLLTLAGMIGVTDIDPFILSLVNQSTLIQSVAVSAIVISMMSNTIVKGLYFGFQAKDVRKSTAWRFGLWALLHLPILLI